MKVAIFSDIHGNTLALDAVLADIAPEDVDAFWIVGDLIALGPYPAEAARALAALPNAIFVRGNTDRYTLEAADARDATGFAASFPWALAAVEEAGLADWLRTIPLESRYILPDGTRVLLVHAAPGRDDGPGIAPEMDAGELATALAEAHADLVIVGHTHIPLDREVIATSDRATHIHVHNLGSVSRPETDEHCAMWTLLTADEAGHTLERRFAPYDITLMKSQLDAVHHPVADTLKAMFP